jgi:hypothetical protein
MMDGFIKPHPMHIAAATVIHRREPEELFRAT